MRTCSDFLPAENAGSRPDLPAKPHDLHTSMKLRILGQFFTYLFRSGKWWLFPIVLLLLVLGLILVIAKGSALAPFIYTLF